MESVSGRRDQRGNTWQFPMSLRIAIPKTVNIMECNPTFLSLIILSSSSSAHPQQPVTYSKRNLQILATPHVHALVVGANIVKVLLVDRKQTAGNGRSSRTQTASSLLFSHPMKVTYRIGMARSPFLLSSSRFGTVYLKGNHSNLGRNSQVNAYQRKFICQLKPPQVMSEAVTYSNVSSEITSIIGATTRVLKRKEPSDHKE